MARCIDPADDGPIFVYFATYERTRLNELALRHPEHAALLARYVGRLVDLWPLVKNNYYHPAMHGSFSIKAVLPTIASELDYRALDEVQDGTAAQLAYLNSAFDPAVTPERKADLDRKLRAYCNRDTWAMVEIAYFLAGAGRPVEGG